MDEIIKLDTTKVQHSTPIENYRRVLSYLVGNIKRSIRLTKKLNDELTILFGKHNTTFRGEFFHRIWIVEFKGETFNIYSSNRGTSIEIVANYDDDKSFICIEFIKTLEEMILKIEKN